MVLVLLYALGRYTPAFHLMYDVVPGVLLSNRKIAAAEPQLYDIASTILGEFGIAIAFALLAGTLRRGSWRQAFIAGIGGGFSIFVCYAVAFWITDRLIT